MTTGPAEPVSSRVAGPALVISCLVIVSCAFALLTGRYGGPDEPSHVIRAAAVAHGDLRGADAPGMVDGFRLVEVPLRIGTGDPRCFRHDPRITPQCAAPTTDRGTVVVATAAGRYPPYYYAVIGGAARLLGQSDNPLAYRVTSAVLVAGVLGFALLRLRQWVSSGAALVVSAMLPPAAWFLFGVVNPNSLEIALFALAWVGVGEFLIDARPGRGTDGLTVAAWAAAAAVLIRPVAVLAVPTLLVVLVTGASRAQWAPMRSRRRITMVLAPLLGAGLLTVGWHLALAAASSDARTASTIPFTDAVRRSFDGTTDTVRELVGSMGWLEYSSPNLAQAAWWAVVGLSAGAALLAGRRLTIAFVATVISVLAIPLVFELVMYRRVGFIWQGRYSIAAALGVAMVGAVAVHRLPGRRQRQFRRVAQALPILAAASLLLSQWHAARRYTVGIDGSWRLTATNAWQPPVHPWLLLAASAVALGALGALWGSTGSDHVAEHVDDHIR